MKRLHLATAVIPAQVLAEAAQARRAALEAVRMIAEATLPDGEHLSIEHDGAGWSVVHEHDGACLNCGGAKRVIRCDRHPYQSCDCDGREEDCAGCEGNGKARVEDCGCEACVSVNEALEQENER